MTGKRRILWVAGNAADVTAGVMQAAASGVTAAAAINADLTAGDTAAARSARPPAKPAPRCRPAAVPSPVRCGRFPGLLDLAIAHGHDVITGWQPGPDKAPDSG